MVSESRSQLVLSGEIQVGQLRRQFLITVRKIPADKSKLFFRGFKEEKRHVAAAARSCSYT